MTDFDEVKDSIRKCLEVIINDKIILKAEFSDNLTAWKFAGVVCNHWFKESNLFFGITYRDGLKMRQYIHESTAGTFGKTPYDYIKKMHEEFGEILSREDERYLKYINEIRKKANFEPLKI